MPYKDKEKYKEYQREYHRGNKKLIEYHKRWKKSEKGKMSAKKTWEKYPNKNKARNRTNKLLIKLNWDRVDNCLGCGELLKLESHHISYKPNIAVFGFCGDCHNEIERGELIIKAGL